MSSYFDAARRAGVLLHITSLSSGWGCGTLGPEARSFADFLSQAGVSIWQVLPLSPTREEHGSSPYSSTSAFAGNIQMISPDFLAEDGLLTRQEIFREKLPSRRQADFAGARSSRLRLLSQAFQRFPGSGLEPEFQRFCEISDYWLDDYTLFEAIRKSRPGSSWIAWPRPLRERDPSSLVEAKAALSEDIAFLTFCQFCFFRQWHQLRDYCRKRGLNLFGDIPLYVDHNSADTWAHRRIFKLRENLRPRGRAGVPPDYFSRSGQLWGNPVYDWDVLAETGYEWWLRRMKHASDLFSLLRLDHFRGFAAYWEVPAGVRTAKKGSWRKGPGRDFLNLLIEELPHTEIVAEDLGVITDDVRELMGSCGFPGMRVLQFGFGADHESSDYNPSNFVPNTVAYTGTHDNNTTRGWYQAETTAAARKRIEAYLGQPVEDNEIALQFCRLALNSISQLAVVPAQDLLGLGRASRMNVPGKGKGNWLWRLKPDEFKDSHGKQLKSMIKQSGRGDLSPETEKGRLSS